MCDCSTTIAVADTRQGYLVRLARVAITAETLTIAGEGVAQPRRARRRVRASTSILRITRYIPPRTLVRVSEPDIDSAVQGSSYPDGQRDVGSDTATRSRYLRYNTGDVRLIRAPLPPIVRLLPAYRPPFLREVQGWASCGDRARRPRNGACRSASYTICVLSIDHY